MKKKDIQNLTDRIANEGFNYTFINYSSFDEIKDETFHELRKTYVSAENELEKYLESQGVELDN